MQIVYRLVGTKALKKVYVRLYHNKLTIAVSTDLFSKDDNWDSNLELFKKNNEANKKLIELKINIETAFNTDFSNGIILDKIWLKSIVAKTFLRPNKEEKMLNPIHTIFLSEFGKHWLKNESKTWRNSNSELLDTREKSQKAKALEQFIEFEQKEAIKAKKEGLKIKLTDFTAEKIKAFYHFLIDQNYSVPTAKKKLYEIKTFCLRAKEMKINVNTDFESNISFKDKSTKVTEVYLNESEINDIYKYDFSQSESMDHIRDNFILSLWTGKRISDLLNLSSENLMNGVLESIDIKTNTLVKVPLHPQVKAIIKKYYGNLPPKVSKDEYNIQIKEICRLCGINKMVLGKVKDSAKNRKVLAYYEKHKLVTSHTARRSFATNLSRFLSITEIAKIGAWADISMVEHYNKTTEEETIEKFNNHFNSTN